MNPLDWVWHVQQYVLPVLFMGLVTPAVCKLFWSNRLQHIAWSVLAWRSSWAGAMVWILSGIWMGYDGAMLSYLALLLANTGVIVWSMR